MKLIVGTSFAATILLIVVSPSLSFVLDSEPISPEAVSVGDLTDGDYFIQSVANSSILIGAFKNGEMVPGPGYVYPANVSGQVHDPNGNLTVEDSLRFYVEARDYDETTSSRVVRFYTRGRNQYNRLDWFDMAPMFPLTAIWRLFDMGNGTVAIRNLDYAGKLQTDCLSENGENNDIAFKPCSRLEVKQLWHFIPAGSVAK